MGNIIQFRNLKHAAKIVTFMGLKGGSGKTSAAFMCGTILASVYKKRVLLVDADITFSTLSALCAAIPEIEISLNNTGEPYIEKEKRHTVNIQGIPNLHLLNLGYGRSAHVEDKCSESSSYLQEKLSPYKEHYDYIFIDTAPYVDSVNSCILKLTDEVIIVSQEDDLESQIWYDMRHINNCSAESKLKGVIVGHFRGTSAEKELAIEVNQKCETNLLGVVRYFTSDIRKASSRIMSDYQSIAKKL